MDINKIFGLFGSKPEEGEGNPPNSELVKELEENHPRYFLGMFTKLINNHLNYQEGLIQMFQSVDPKLDMGDVRAAGENLLYNRAWKYIENFNIEDKYSQEIINENSPLKTEYAIISALIYFEKEEEYEKCAFLKKFLDFLNPTS